MFKNSLTKLYFNCFKYSLNQRFFSSINQHYDNFGSEESVLPVIRQSNIKDNYGARMRSTRLGRGPGSSKGKTSGRGHKGYMARTGNAARHFEGGQTPMTRRLPKHGFSRNGIKDKLVYINIDKIVYLINKKRIDPTKPITIKEIFYAGGISKTLDGVKLLGRGAHLLKSLPPLNIEVSFASKDAIDQIKENGGNVTCKYRTALLLKYLIKPFKFHKELTTPYPPFTEVKKILNEENKGAMYIIINLVLIIRNHYG
jgi:large subunit ribosomal protein L15